MRFTPESLADAVQGDLEAFSILLQQPHASLLECRANVNDLTLNAAAVRKVLLALQQDQVPQELIRQWASFVQRGYIADSRSSEPIMPIDIDYDPPLESEISEVISRLESIGDAIDGEIENDELILMLEKLDQKHAS